MIIYIFYPKFFWVKFLKVNLYLTCLIWWTRVNKSKKIIINVFSCSDFVGLLFHFEFVNILNINNDNNKAISFTHTIKMDKQCLWCDEEKGRNKQLKTLTDKKNRRAGNQLHLPSAGDHTHMVSCFYTLYNISQLTHFNFFKFKISWKHTC